MSEQDSTQYDPAAEAAAANEAAPDAAEESTEAQPGDGAEGTDADAAADESSD